MNLRITLFFFALVFVSSIPLFAQDDSAPPLHIIGAAADSITGGEPSVMIRRSADADLKTQHRNLLFSDPIKMFFFYNLSYYRGISSSFAVGGGLQIAPGIEGMLRSKTSDAETETNGFGAQLGAKWFLGKYGLKGGHVDPTLCLYSVTHKDKAQTPLSLIVDVAYQWNLMRGFFVDLQFGCEFYLIPLREGPGFNSDAIFEDAMFMVGTEDHAAAFHIALQMGSFW